MAYDSLFRKGVAIIDKQTGTSGHLQETITLQSWIGQDEFGKAQYAAPQQIPAFVERGFMPRQTMAGVIVIVKATVIFPRPLPPNGAPGRLEPIDKRDRITLQGDVAPSPIINVEGPVDPTTGRGYYSQVLVGG